MKPFAIILIVVGITMLIFKGFSYSQEKNVANIGPIEINKTEHKNVEWPLYAGGIALVAGMALLIVDKKQG
ncbi:MAG TPA: hypothetical protein VK705_07285 [Ferruginibacter sp.]|jgi:hypothetical protein|nr:hypothetical protein [Ferruginibacter sp.]